MTNSYNQDPQEFNPYASPKSDVIITDSYDGELLSEPNKLSAGTGWAFISDAFTIFKDNMGSWFLAGLAYIAIIIMLSLVSVVLPVLPDIAMGIIAQFMVVGFAYKAHLQVNGHDNTVSDIFAGFKMNAGRQIGLYFMFMLMIVIFVVFAVFLSSMFLGGFAMFTNPENLMQEGQVLSIALLMMLVGFAFMIPVLMAYWFAPILIGVHDMGIIDAMKLSFKACLRNALPFLVFSLIFTVLAIIASIPLFLGWLILLPVLLLTYYTSYRYILTE